MSNLGNMGAPFLVTLSDFLNFKAVFVGGFLNLAGGASMLLVKETLKDEAKKDEEGSNEPKSEDVPESKKSLLTDKA